MRKKGGVAQVKKLLDQTRAFGDELRAISEHSQTFNPRAVTLREKLKHNYLRLVALDPRAAHSISRNVVWQLVFYATIERLRRQQKQLENATDASAQDKQRHLEILASFLKQSEHFYRDVTTTVQKTYGSIGVTLPGEDVSKKEKGPRFLNNKMALSSFACYESLLFLGDILRYAQIHLSHESQRSFKHSAMCYRQAAYLCPQSGNPHNQLSVVFLYTKDDLRAVYHNYRAFYSETPFPTSKANFKVLFEKITSKAYKAGKGSGGFSAGLCVLHLLRASAVLFSSLREKEESMFEESYHKFLYQFKQFCEFSPEDQRAHLSSNPKKEVKDSQIIYLFLRVVVLTICNAHTAIRNGKQLDDLKKRKRGEEKMDKYVRRYLLMALAVQVDLVQYCMVTKKVSALGLPAIKVFCSWLRSNGLILELFEEDNQLQIRYKRFLDAITALLKDIDIQPKNQIENTPLYGLMEDVELRGFTPLLKSQKSMTFEVWQCAQRPVESNYRKCVRLARLLDDVRALTGKMDLFPRQEKNGAKPGGPGTVKDDQIQVWKGPRDFRPVPEGVFPKLQHLVGGDKTAASRGFLVQEDHRETICNDVFAIGNNEKPLEEEYRESFLPDPSSDFTAVEGRSARDKGAFKDFPEVVA